MQTIFKEFEGDKRPHQVVAMYGYDPDFVSEDYLRYNKMKGFDMKSVQRAILEALGAGERRPPEFGKYHYSFNRKGSLTQNETFELLDKAVTLEVREMLNMLLTHPSVTLPDFAGIELVVHFAI